jgi:hypothetical protein
MIAIVYIVTLTRSSSPSAQNDNMKAQNALEML